jgi:HEAT repeat protein
MLRNLIVVSSALLWFSTLHANEIDGFQPRTSRDKGKPAAPQTQKKPLSYWFHNLASADSSSVQKAIQALYNHLGRSFDRPTVPIFPDSDQLAARERLRSELRPLLGLLLNLLDHSDDEIRAIGAMALACIGPEASAARPRLLRMIEPPLGNNVARYSRTHAAIALCYVSPPHVAVGPDLLCAFYRTPEQDVQAHAPSAELQDAIDDFSGGFGAVIMRAVLIETNRTVIEIPTMAQVARTTTLPRTLRLMILNVFESLGTDARAAVPVLAELLNDTDPLIRKAAARVLILSKQTPAEAEEIIRLLQIDDTQRALVKESVKEHFEEKSRRTAQTKETFAANDPSDWFVRYTKQSLTDALRGSFHFNQRNAIKELGEMGELAKWAVPDLVKLLNSPEAYTREEALNALRKIDPDAIPQSTVYDMQRPRAEPEPGQISFSTSIRRRSRGNRAFTRHQRRMARR